MKTLYHSSMYDFDHPVDSYWESSAGPHLNLPALEGDEQCDVAVIGGGFTGLSAALHLARDYGVDVCVLEAGHLGWGASGRNGGLCCLAATKLSISEMIDRYGLEETQRFYATQLEGIELVRALGQEESIDYDLCGDGTFDVAHKPSRSAGLKDEVNVLHKTLGIDATFYNREEFAELGYQSTEQFGALHVAAGFALHPLKFALGLARAAARRGARLYPHSCVLEWRKHEGLHELRTARGCLRARRVVVATNGFTPERLHESLDARLLPAMSNIVTTRPMSDEELARHGWRTDSPCCNTRTMLFYYRMLPDKRFLFGARGDTSGRPADAERMRGWMTRRLHEVFPGWKDIPISHFWRGLVCATRKLSPSIGRLDDDPGVWYGFGYHGNGVNTAPWAGMMLARHIAGTNHDQVDLPAVVSGLPARFPLAGLRLWALRGAYAWYRIQDAR